MARKVNITAEQEKALSIVVSESGRDDVINSHDQGDWDGELKSLNGLSRSGLARALLLGYEVEPEFKVGDWVVTETGYVGEIEFINELEGWANIGYSKDTKERGTCLAKTYRLNKIKRHATPSEIAEEKERRWWKKHGRDVWELKSGDILLYLDDLLIVDRGLIKRPDSNEVRFVCGEEHVYEENINFVMEHFEVVCFAENRLDGDSDE